MTILAAEVPFLDVEASALSLWLDAPVLEPIIARSFQLGAVTVRASVLSASHQVVVASAGAVVLSEVVSCHRPSDALPPSRERGGYHFASSVEQLPAAAFDAEVSRMRAIAEDPARHVVAASFPGPGSALTMIEVCHLRTGYVAWQSWHTYPGARTIVSTRSSIDLTIESTR